MATDKLEALLESSSAIAALGAAKELLNRTAPKPEPEPEPIDGRRGVSLLEILAVAAACAMDLDALVSAAKARAPAVESS